MKTISPLASLAFAIHIAAFASLAQDNSGNRSKIPPGGLRLNGGFINLVEGDAERMHGAERQPLQSKLMLENGDSIVVSSTGRTEILLTPGYYLRLGSNTRVTFLDLSPGNLKFKIWNGAAIVEMSLNDWMVDAKRTTYDLVTVSTPRDEYALPVGGAYRFNVRADGSSEVNVIKGVAVISGASLKSGVSATVSGGHVENSKLIADAFDNWSRDRATLLTQANKALKRAKWFKDLQAGRIDISAQESERRRLANDTRMVSARSGFVPLAEDGALFQRGGADWEKLKSGDAVASGDKVKTGADCRVDIRPLPDVALLVAPDTELVYREDSNGDLSFEVLKGSAIIVPQFLSGTHQKSAITLLAAPIKVDISKSGVYRVNADPARGVEMLTYEGEARLNGREVKAARKVQSAASGLTIVEFNKSAQDSFAAWAEKRRQSLLVEGRRHYYSELGGVWFVIEATGEYTFVPMVSNYQSPYGGEYAVKYSTNVGDLHFEPGEDDNQPKTGPVSGRNPDSPTGNGMPDPKQPKPPR